MFTNENIANSTKKSIKKRLGIFPGAQWKEQLSSQKVKILIKIIE